MTVKRLDNIGIVVQDLDAAIACFTDLGLELEGRAPIQGDWADGVTGLLGMRVEIAAGERYSAGGVTPEPPSGAVLRRRLAGLQCGPE